MKVKICGIKNKEELYTVETVRVPVILEGGLNPENVRQAIQTVEPYRVDANSGLKGANNLKDPEKVKKFVLAAKCSKF